MRVRDQRGVVLPSPLVMLSVIAVAMAAIAFVATRGGEPTEREITPAWRAGLTPDRRPRLRAGRRRRTRSRGFRLTSTAGWSAPMVD